MKKGFSLLLCLGLLLSLAACANPVIGTNDGSEPGGTVIGGKAPESGEAVITLSGDSASYPGGGVAISGSTVTIGAAGDYVLRGTLNDGRIIIDTKESPGKVNLTLDGADITCLTDSAIYVQQAKEVNLILAAGSENRVVSGTEADAASYDDTRSGAAIFAEDDLDIQGEGSLTILGYWNNGVTCKDDLKIKGGSITVVAAHNGLRGSESVTISAGTVDVTAAGDGVKAISAVKAGKGFVLMEGGSLKVRSVGDGVSAESELSVTGGELSIETSGDPGFVSSKGLKGTTALLISGGTVSVNSRDHALKCDAGISISGGELSLRSSDGKGLSAGTAVDVSGGTLTVDAIDDGINAAESVTVSDGVLLVSAGADGIQGGKKGTGFGDAVGSVSILGGTVAVSSSGKPIDAKASFTVSGGTVFVCGSIGSGKLMPDNAIPYALFSTSGAGGATLQISDPADELTLRAAYPFNTVLYLAPSLNAGQSCSLSVDGRTLTAQIVG